MGKQLTKDLDGDGVLTILLGSLGGTGIVDLILVMVAKSSDEALTKCMLTEQAAVEAIKWMADLVLVHHIQPPPEMQAGDGCQFQNSESRALASQPVTSCGLRATSCPSSGTSVCCLPALRVSDAGVIQTR